MKIRTLLMAVTIGTLICLPATSEANVKFSPLFADNMLLQRDKPIRIWGIANPNESVEVTLGKNKVTGKANQQGWWLVELPALAKGENLMLTAKGENTVSLKNIIMGDIWICSGQSNMHFSLKSALGAKEDISKANYPKIRHMKVAYLSPSPYLEKHVAIGLPWQECSPKTASKFTAVGFYFARNVFEETGVPIGLVNVNRGGTKISSWMSIESFMKVIPSRAKASKYSMGRYTKWQLAKTLKESKEWTVLIRKALKEGKLKDHDVSANSKLPGLSVKGLAALEKWLVLADAAEKKKQMNNESGKRLSGPPKLKFIKPKDNSISNPPHIHSPPNGGSGWLGAGGYTLLYNGMINPLLKFQIKGFLWYQGESDALPQKGDPHYFNKMKNLVESWRQAWGQKDLPFYFVQIPNWKNGIVTPAGGGGWAQLQIDQLKSMTIKNSGMVVTIDIGDEKDLHPKNKVDIGLRLSRWALNKDYGKNDLVASGPLYKEMKIDGNKIRLQFNHTGSGLMIGKKIGRTSTIEDKSSKLKLFAIAGADKKWFWATATIDKNTLIVTSAEVKNPVAVRYAFTRNAKEANLYNKEGLPASPFKTDDW